MGSYRNRMERILKQMENDTIITNPKGRGKTFLRKIAYRFAYWIDHIGNIFHRRQNGNKNA